ncbi:MAG: 3-phosphoshikimate 1-carboxyvinyltransferase [Clostridia bacterium]|nr:3-phosphoshikimate 1-carboxyvinyltransferase [Clostridia bacterium]
MAQIKLYKSQLFGEVPLCTSKSIAHRALICSALSGRDIVINNVEMSDDICATINALKALGVNIEYCDKRVEIKKGNIKLNNFVLINALESGSTLRFLIPVCISLNRECEFTGEGRLPKRPLDDYFSIFDNNGIEYERGKDYLPLKTKGTFKSREFNVKGNVSSQFITGLMLSSIVCNEETIINITTPLESKPYIDITKKVLEDFGHRVYFKDNIIKVKKGKTKISSYNVEKDWSQAAFFLAAGAIFGDITIKDMNLNSSQGDIKIVDILQKMGADISVSNDVIRVKKSSLKGINIDVSDIPDLVPALSVLGAVAKGETNLYNAGRLRLKESDRILSTVKMLESFNVKVDMGEDFLKIYYCDNLKGGTVNSFNDHRIVMAASVMATMCDETVIKGCDAVKKSYPEFFNDYFKVGGKGEFINE